MADLKEIVGLKSDEDFKSMLANGSITYGDETVEFTEQSIYVTPEEEIKVPTKTSELINDSRFITASDIPTIPNKTSDLINDSGFVVKERVDSLEADIDDLQTQIDEIHTDNLVDLETNQEIGGVKTFKENIGIKNEDGTVDYLKHINNNFLISTSTGTNLMNIDEGLSKAYFFNKEIAFKENVYDKEKVDEIAQNLQDQITTATGGEYTKVTVDGVYQRVFDADTKADVSELENKANQSDLNATNTKVNSNETMLNSLAVEVANAQQDISDNMADISALQTDKADKTELFSGSYDDLTNKPTLFSGSYNDLTDKPTIPDTSALEAQIATKASQTSLDAEISARTTNDTSLQTQINTIRDRDHVLYADVSKGYIKFTDGTMICWGVISFSTAGYQSITFGSPFANTNYAISFGYVSNYTGTGGMGRREDVADTYSTTGFRVYATEAKGNKTYIAVGKYL